jgi:DNA-binding NarL/FixJ family response regulator
MNILDEKIFDLLIVEDSAEFRHMLKKVLQSRFPSFRISEAEDGEAALVLIRRQQPDLIFMDIRLPGQSGIALTEKIKRQHPAIVIVMLTSMDTSDYRTAAFERGADYFLSKEKSSAEDILELVACISGGAGAGTPSPQSDPSRISGCI